MKNILLTAVVTFLLTVLLGGGFLYYYYGIERFARDVSPFIDTARDKVTEAVAPATQTVPKTEADKIMDAVAGTQGASALIFKTVAGEETFVARGLLVSTDGLILTDSETIIKGVPYTVRVPGVRDYFPVTHVTELSEALTLLKIEHTTTLVPRFTDNSVLPESLVVAITGDETQQIATGIVTVADEVRGVIRTNLFGTMAPGSVLVTVDGFAVGISTVAAQGEGQASFTPLTRSYINDVRQSALF